MQKEFFGEEKRQYDDNRPQYAVASLLLRNAAPTGRVLDVGSGLGEFSDVLVRKGYEVFGIEGVEEFVAKQSQRGLNVQHVNLEQDLFPFDDNSFDIVVSLDVIEHLWNTTHYLSEISRCLKSSGIFIVSTVNYNYWRYRLLHIRGKMEKFMLHSGTRSSIP